MSRMILFALAALTFAAPALARADDDPDTEVARRLFIRGRDLYAAENYAQALDAFEKARVAKPLPAFDFNIARCYDRLGRWSEALAAYERFVVKATDPAEVKEAEGRIAVLRDRVKQSAARAAAEEHYKKAIALYNGDQFRAAVDEFKKANAANPDPLYLYNIAQSFRFAGDAPRALDYYEQFLKAAPDTPLRAAVAARVAELKAGRQPDAPVANHSRPAGASQEAVTSERLKPIVEVIKTNRAGFRACFDKWSAAHPGVSGKVNLAFYLDPDGVMNQAGAETVGFDAPEVGACIVAHARTLKYPPAPNGKYTRFNYPFDFKAN